MPNHTTKVTYGGIYARYRIGTVLYGNNKSIGNLWVINEDDTLNASLLYDGITKSIPAAITWRLDKMSLGMCIATLSEVVMKCGSINLFPNWAKSLIEANQSPFQSTLPVPSINLPHGAMQQIQKALSITTTQDELKDLGLTKPRAYGNFESIHDDTIYTVRDCPSRKEGLCSYLPYYGFTENYEYCEFCDDKRRMKR